jgi:hypothetical protein
MVAMVNRLRAEQCGVRFEVAATFILAAEATRYLFNGYKVFLLEGRAAGE